MDRIAIHGIRVEARHGANPGERERAQTFEIDVVAEIDLAEPSASDDVESTLHYGRLYERIAAAVKTHGCGRLKPLFLALEEKVPYDDIRVVATHLTPSEPEA